MEKGVAGIIMDDRENKTLAEELIGLGANVVVKRLDVGDFILSERVIAERKTRADFESSIIDGRLFAQLKNLSENYPRVAIIVEGEVTEGRVSKEALLGAYAAVVSDFGASIFFTRNLEKTAELIFALAKHDQLAKKQVMRVFAKRKTLTASANQRAMIEMLPMVGPKLAKALLVHFKNIENLVNASEEELKKVEGMGEKRAKAIRSIIENSYDEEEDKAMMI